MSERPKDDSFPDLQLPSGLKPKGDAKKNAVPAKLTPVEIDQDVQVERFDEQGRRIVILPKKPGFGFWMSGVWCLLYLSVTQLIPGVIMAIGAVMIVARKAKAGDLGQDPRDIFNDPDMSNLIAGSLMLAHFVGILFSLAMLRFLVGKQWKRTIAFRRLPSVTHVALILLGFPAMLSVSAALEVPVMKYIPSVKDLIDMPGLAEMMKMMAAWPLPLAILAIAVLPAIGEELWCRGFLGQGTSARYGIILSVFITSFFFGAIHMEPPQALLAGLLGIAIHLCYVATRSFLVPVALHFGNNFLAVMQISDSPYAVKILTPLEEALKAEPWVFTFISIGFLVTVGYALYQTRSKLVPSKPGVPAWEPTGVDGVELPPENSQTVVDHDPLAKSSVIFVLLGSMAFGAILFATA